MNFFFNIIVLDQQPPQQHWMQYPLSARNPYNDDLHLQDQYQVSVGAIIASKLIEIDQITNWIWFIHQVPMDYYNSMLPQNQPPIMPSMHYSQMAQPEIGQDLWDHEKHVSRIFRCRNCFTKVYPIENAIANRFCPILSSQFRIKDGQNGITSQLASWIKPFFQWIVAAYQTSNGKQMKITNFKFKHKKMLNRSANESKKKLHGKIYKKTHKFYQI